MTEMLVTITLILILFGIGAGGVILMSRGMSSFAFSSQVEALVMKARNDALGERAEAFFAIDAAAADGVNYQLIYAAGKHTIGLWHFEEIDNGLTKGFPPGADGSVADAELVDGENRMYGDTARGGRYGKVGNCLFFGGRTEVTVRDKPAFSATGGVAVEAWILPFAEPDGTIRGGYVFQRGSDYVLGLNSDRTVFAQVCGVSIDSETYTIAVFSWSHVAVVHDGSRLRLSVNGHEVAAAAAGEALSPLGGDVAIGNGFVGFIDEVRLSGFFSDKKFKVPAEGKLEVIGSGSAVGAGEGPLASFRVWFDQRGCLDPVRHMSAQEIRYVESDGSGFSYKVEPSGNIVFTEISPTE